MSPQCMLQKQERSKEGMNEWASEGMNEWMNEWKNEDHIYHPAHQYFMTFPVPYNLFPGNELASPACLSTFMMVITFSLK